MKENLIATTYQIKDEFEDLQNPGIIVKFQRMISPFYDGEKWAVRRRSFCLNLDAKWEVEPMPSSRDDKFYARCRFASLDEAVEAYNQAKAD